MACHPEAAWKLGVQSEFASLQFEDLATSIATKMMMMGLARHLIPQCLSRHGNRRQPVTFQQCADIAVDRGDAQPFDFGLSRGQHLFG